MASEQAVKKQMAALAVSFADLKAAAVYQQYVRQLLITRPPLADEDVEAAADYLAQHAKATPTIAEIIQTAKDHGRRRQDAIRADHRAAGMNRWTQQMRSVTRTCQQEGCEEPVWIIDDRPEPRQHGATAHMRLWCPECVAVQQIDVDPVSRGVRCWLTPDDLDEIVAEGIEPVYRMSDGVHHMIELRQRMKHQASPMQAYRVRELETASPDNLITPAEVMSDLLAR